MLERGFWSFSVAILITPLYFFTWKPMRKILYFCFIEVFYRRDKADCSLILFKGEKGE